MLESNDVAPFVSASYALTVLLLSGLLAFSLLALRRARQSVRALEESLTRMNGHVS